MRTTIPRVYPSFTALLASVGMALSVSAASPANAASSKPLGRAERRCALAVLAARRHVEGADTRTLSRCALAVMSDGSPSEIEERCRCLRTAYDGIDLVDRRASGRVADWCAQARPRWLGEYCEGSGTWRGRPLSTASDVGRCVVGSAHCSARRAVEAVLGDLAESVGAENPENLLFEYGGVGGNSFAECAAEATSACPE